MSGAERARASAPQQDSSRTYRLELRDRLAECSSKFHALLFMAGFWNPSTQLHCDQADGRVLSGSETAIVRELHEALFEQWLLSSLADQHAEFGMFLSTMTSVEQAAFLQFIRSPQATELIPPQDATPEQRALFGSDLKTLAILAPRQRATALPWPR